MRESGWTHAECATDALPGKHANQRALEGRSGRSEGRSEQPRVAGVACGARAGANAFYNSSEVIDDAYSDWSKGPV